MKITFCGAAQQVTGSMYHVEFEQNFQILVDCGLDYERSTHIEQNASFHFDPVKIRAVILTHAHIDHCGNLPTLFAQGFSGPVFCTEPTAALADILLQDSARIQLGKRLKKSRKNSRKKIRTEKALFGYKQVTDAIGSMITLPLNRTFELRKGISFEFISAGHILGAASVIINWQTDQGTRRIGFTGDLGRTSNPLVGAPDIPQNLDYLVMEGTYGSRDHQEKRDPEEVLLEEIRKLTDLPFARLIIPAFSVGRTQALLFTLHKLYREQKLPTVKVFADSPLGMNSGEIHQRFYSWLKGQAREFAETYGNIFAFKHLYLVEDREDEEYMSAYQAPSILISSAGMMDGGRIQRHIAVNIENPEAHILIAGYCAEGTLGHELLERKSSVRIKGREYRLYAQIASTDVYSAHPDRNELREYLDRVVSAGRLKTIFLTHGDADSLNHFRASISHKGFSIEIPSKNQQMELEAFR